MEKSTMKTLATEATIRNLAERYPFDDHELEILVRCHDHLVETSDNREDFLLNLALASPYSHFFLPGDEMRDRVNWIENNILPPGFASSLRAGLSVDAFVEYANQGESKSLERFIEGVADTGRRGTREALRVLFNLAPGMLTPEDVMDCVVRLAVADQVLMGPNLDKVGTLQKLESLQPLVKVLAEGANQCLGQEPEEMVFVKWAEENFPFLKTPLSTFVHHILFHEHPYPTNKACFAPPQLDHLSDVFARNSLSLMALSFMASEFHGKWHRLYSSESDGKSFNRLEWSLLGYTGPTLLVVKTDHDAVLGAYTAIPWKESTSFYGGPDCFLMQLVPHLKVFRPVLGNDGEDHFVYLHSSNMRCPLDPPEAPQDTPCGLGFGGGLNGPRFFIPESLEHCSADFLDKTFESGELLPAADMETFEIQYMEVWAVGGVNVIQQALRDRAEHRDIAEIALKKARTVNDKTIFAEDFKSDLIPNQLFAHTKDTRGRHEFRVDDVHGGYVIDDKKY